MFFGKLESESPVKITGLSSPPNGNLSFYNSNTGSRVVDATVDFKYDIPKCMTINEIINTGKKGTLDVLRDKKIVRVGQNKVLKYVRDALIADDSASVKVSTWGKPYR